MSNVEQPCPCCSGKKYEECCKPFHDGNLPQNALQLMRSRYTAYVLNLPDYIIETTHTANPQYIENKFAWKRNISHRSQNTTYKKLEILDFKEKEPFATVIFTITLAQKDEEEIVYSEISVFEKVDGRWLYRSGRLERGRAVHFVTPGELRLLPLAYYGDPILRKKAEPIEEITPEIKKLVEDMVETMDICDGIGLAAPQIHHSIRLFIIRVPMEQDDHIEYGDVKVFINPKLSSPSEETWLASEGCLSIPQIRGKVKRPKEITISYTALDGTVKTERVKGWEAKIIMHENDHINGVLFIDRLDPDDKAKYEAHLKKLEKRLNG